MRNTILSLLLVAGLVVAVNYRSALQQFSVSIDKVNLLPAAVFTNKSTPQGTITLTLSNPSNAPLYASEVVLQLLYKGNYLGTAQILHPIYLSASSTLQVIADVFINTLNTITSIVQLVASGGTNDFLNITGHVRIGPANIPIAFSYPVKNILTNG